MKKDFILTKVIKRTSWATTMLSTILFHHVVSLFITCLFRLGRANREAHGYYLYQDLWNFRAIPVHATSASSRPTNQHRSFRVMHPHARGVQLFGATWHAVYLLKGLPGDYSLLSKGVLPPILPYVLKVVDAIGIFKMIHQWFLDTSLVYSVYHHSGQMD